MTVSQVLSFLVPLAFLHITGFIMWLRMQRRDRNGAIEQLRFSVAKFHLEDGDILVIRYPGCLSSELAERIRNMIEPVLHGRKVLVFERGMDFEILSQAAQKQLPGAA